MPLLLLLYLIILILIKKYAKYSKIDEFIRLFLYYFWGFIILNIGWDIIDSDFTFAEMLIDAVVLLCSVGILIFYSIKNYSIKWMDLYWVLCAICFYFIIFKLRGIINL
jgi:hypothetical protein